MGWPYPGTELTLMYGVQPNAFTPVTPDTLVGSVVQSPNLRVDAGTRPFYNIGDYAPPVIKGGPVSVNGNVRLLLVPYAANFLKCALRNNQAGLGYTLPWLTIGLAYQGTWRNVHCGCKLASVRVSSAEGDFVTADAAWQALYPADEFLGLTAPVIEQSPVAWHEVALTMPDASATWGWACTQFQWQVQNTLVAHYGHGQDPYDYTPRRGARYITETTQQVSFNFRLRELMVAPETISAAALINQANVYADYRDTDSGAGFLARIANGKWQLLDAEAVTPERLAQWGVSAVARGIQLEYPLGTPL